MIETIEVEPYHHITNWIRFQTLPNAEPKPNQFVTLAPYQGSIWNDQGDQTWI